MISPEYVQGKVRRFILRIPPDLHVELKALADIEERSLHAQILFLLRGAIRDKKI